MAYEELISTRRDEFLMASLRKIGGSFFDALFTLMIGKEQRVSIDSRDDARDWAIVGGIITILAGFFFLLCEILPSSFTPEE